MTGNGRFLYSSFNLFFIGRYDAFLRKTVCRSRSERGGRVFPAPTALSISLTLWSAPAIKSGAKIICDRVTGIDIKKA